MKKQTTFISLGLALLMAFTLACGTVTSLITGGGSKAVSDLWSDVPPMDGMTKSEASLPPAVKLIINGMAKAATASDEKTEVTLSDLDFIAYTIAKEPKDVQAFYTTEKMTAAGWNLKDQVGCAGGTADAGVGGAFCLFGKEDGNKKTILFIVSTQDENDKTKTTVFFARLEGTLKQK